MRHHLAWVALGLIVFASAWAHLAHAAVFHDVLMDEGIYINRAINILQGQALQNPPGWYAHPFFGWVFMAVVFRLVGYPPWTVGDAAASPFPCTPACSLILVPRLLAATLAVVDTLLIYGIARRLYGSRWAALGAAAFFALTPATWLFTLVLLDSFFVFWTLLGLLLLLMGQGRRRGVSRPALFTASGLAVGLAFITKIPALTFLPLFVMLLFPGLTRWPRRSPRGRRPKSTALRKERLLPLLWFAGAAAGALLWVGYALVVGEFQDLLKGIFWQSGRAAAGGATLVYKGNRFEQLWGYLTNPENNYGFDLLALDPVLLVMGTVAIAYALLRRDRVVAGLVVPYAVFLWYTVHKQFWFVAPLLPGASIALGRMAWDTYHWAAGVGRSENALTGARQGPASAAHGGGWSRRRRITGSVVLAAFLSLLAFQALQLAPYVQSDRATAQHQALDYVLENAPAGMAVVSSAAYDWILRHYRPDLQAMNYYQANFSSFSFGPTGKPTPYITVTLLDSRGNVAYRANRISGVHNITVAPGTYLMHVLAGPSLLGRFTVDLTQGLHVVVTDGGGGTPQLATTPSGPPGSLVLEVRRTPRPFWLIMDGVLEHDALTADQWLAGFPDPDRPTAIRQVAWAPNLAFAYGLTDGSEIYRGSRADATYVLEVSPGTYSVKAWSKGNAFLGETTVDVRQDRLLRLDPVEAKVIPANPTPASGLNLTVQVLDSLGRPSPWAWVEVSRTHNLASFTVAGETVVVRQYNPLAEAIGSAGTFVDSGPRFQPPASTSSFATPGELPVATARPGARLRGPDPGNGALVLTSIGNLHNPLLRT